MVGKQRLVLVGIAALLVVAVLGAFGWALLIPSPMPEALDALVSDEQVKVEVGRWLLFRPLGREPDAGLVFYPGARVDPRAYGPAARAIAVQGYLVVIVPMPLNLAVLGSESATAVIEANPQVDRWAVGGHSLGGAMAARYAYRNRDRVQGLVLWAAYPAGTDSLADRELAAASIYGTRDGLATVDKIEASRPLLPADTRWVAVEGGNHVQFGWYGDQPGDLAADLGREEQQRQVVMATVALLRVVSEAR